MGNQSTKPQKEFKYGAVRAALWVNQRTIAAHVLIKWIRYTAENFCMGNRGLV